MNFKIMYNIAKVTTLAFVLSIPLASGAVRALSSPEEGNETMPTQQKIDYREYLRNIGDKLDCYFTVEEIYTQNPGFTDYLISPGDDATIDAVVVKLNRDFKGFRAARDNAIPSVVHLTSIALPKPEEYVMDRKVSLKFRGRLDGLILQLNESYPAFGHKNFGAIGDEPGYFHTAVNLNVENWPLRQLLTSAIPLAGYNRIIWEAVTTLDEGQLYTGIKYLGPKDWDTWFKDVDISKPLQFTRKVMYFIYLRDVGERLGCYFTIEENHERPVKKNSEFYVLPGGDDTVDAVVAKLNKELKRYKAVRDGAQPSVIHLTNVSLTEAGLNVLDKKVTLSYRGTIGGLLDQLHQIDPAIGNAIPVDNHGEGVVFEDDSEKIKAMPVAVEARDLPIRQILTSAVSLPGYYPIIWTAHTNLEEGKLFTGISYSGPKPPKK